MEYPDDNVVELEGRDSDTMLATLVSDYSNCNERRRSAICRFAHKLAEMEPHLSATILPFPPV